MELLKDKKLILSKKEISCRQIGFSLIELLVVTAIIGVLGVVSAAIISSILKSQNKAAITTEVRQNGSRVIELFERDVRSTRCVNPPACNAFVGNRITLEMADGSGNIVWDCSGSAPNFNRNGAPLTNTDAVDGVLVKPGSCRFTSTAGGADIPQMVQLKFNLIQASVGLSQQFNIDVPFEVTVGTRAY